MRAMRLARQLNKATWPRNDLWRRLATLLADFWLPLDHHVYSTGGSVADATPETHLTGVRP